MNSDQTKNRQRAELPLRTDLADDLRTWLATLRDDHQGPSDAEGERIALTFQRDAGNALPLDTPLFNVPKGLVRILDRDLIAAGIPKRDERGRTIDVHALRHTFGTLLSKGGVAPRTAQAANGLCHPSERSAPNRESPALREKPTSRSRPWSHNCTTKKRCRSLRS